MTAGLLPAPTDEQAMLVDASVRLMDAEVPLAVIRAAADGAEESIDGYTATAAELGWFGLLADEASGGGSLSGNGLLDAALVASERGGRLQPGPFVGHSVVVGALAAAGGHADRLAELDRRGAPGRRGRSTRPCRAGSAGSGDDLRLDGTVAVVADADRCGLLLVPALGPDGPAQVLVATDAPGVDGAPPDRPRRHPPLGRRHVRRRRRRRRRPRRRRRARRPRQPSPTRPRSPPCWSPPSRSVRCGPTSTWRSPTPRTASPSAARSARSRASSTCSPTPAWRSRWRGRRGGGGHRPRRRRRPTARSWPTRPRRSSPSTASSSPTPASRCSAASGTRGSTTSTSSCGASPPTPSCFGSPGWHRERLLEAAGVAR